MQPNFPRDTKGRVHIQRVIDMLNQQLYSGYFEYAKWGIGLTRGKHEPIISFDIYNRIIEAESPTVIRAYETKIAKLENEKIILREKLAFAEEAPTDFETSFQTVFDFIENPQKLWHSEDIEHKRIVLKLTFARPLQYRRNEGFQTAALALPFAVLRDFSNGKSGMVGGNGLSSNVDLVALADDIQRIGFILENPPMEFGAAKKWSW